MIKDIAAGLGDEESKYVKNILEDTWDGFSEEERSEITNFLSLMAIARLLELAGQDIGITMDALNATADQWKVAGKIVFASAVKQTAREVLGLGGEFLGGLLRGLLVKL